MVSSESNEVCSKEDRKTIAPEHVLKELQSLRDSESYTRWFSVLGNYIEDVYAAYEQHKLETMDPVRGGKCANVREMTEEEAAAEQQRMFAEEARARMNGVAPTVSVTKVSVCKVSLISDTNIEPQMHTLSLRRKLYLRRKSCVGQRSFW
ncbi:putative transcription factor Hap3/NF-YB family [Helianthus annuus]|nr:putative transcription factor Hap3/NF-YB family [Helianthus annuus]KAJ0722845.1 putative transcription factor Hap3/NF-YB family [Helianthus annuus]